MLLERINVARRDAPLVRWRAAVESITCGRYWDPDPSARISFLFLRRAFAAIRAQHAFARAERALQERAPLDKVLLYVCPHAAVYVSSCCCVCVLMLLCICPHAAVYVSSCCCVCVLMLLYMCPHAAYVSSCCCVCVLMLLCMCPHAAPLDKEAALLLQQAAPFSDRAKMKQALANSLPVGMRVLRVRALQTYEPATAEELAFKQDDVITICATTKAG